MHAALIPSPGTHMWSNNLGLLLDAVGKIPHQGDWRGVSEGVKRLITGLGLLFYDLEVGFRTWGFAMDGILSRNRGNSVIGNLNNYREGKW